ncbi:MAG: DUF6702 family protein [Saprospiraceae bacterium]|nr:DUF6702 family protein [Saprospiraceae bacterium]
MLVISLFLSVFGCLTSESQAIASAHPLKMCVCDVKHLPDKQQLVFRFKFFQDDLEATLEKQSGRELDLRRPSPENDRLLDAFVKKDFDLKINGRPVPIRLVKSAFQEPVLQAEWVAEGFSAAESYSIELRNQILLDVFPDQYNLVRFDFFDDGNLETLRFERAERFLSKHIRRR